MYKYLEHKDKVGKKEKNADMNDDDYNSDASENSELEAFAEKEILKEMKRLQSGAGGAGSEDDDFEDVSYSEDEGEADEDNKELGEGDDDFFSDEDDLKEVKQDDEEDSEVEFSGSEQDEIDNDDAGSDYGDEYGQEMEEEDIQ